MSVYIFKLVITSDRELKGTQSAHICNKKNLLYFLCHNLKNQFIKVSGVPSHLKKCNIAQNQIIEIKKEKHIL